jgi:uncharacterized protein (TIGR03435 family)
MNSAIPLLLLSALSAYPPSASFDVASIKPSTAEPGSSGVDTDKGLLRMQNVTLRRCMMSAYAVPERQILGGPKWIDDLRYDIIARTSRMDDGVDLMAMLQSLLAERFRLTLHHGTQSLPGYSLTVIKGGVKATPSPSDAGGSSTSGGRGSIEAKGATMARLAMRLSNLLGAPVVDMTEEKRRFDFSLHWVPDQMLAGSGAAEAPTGPSLYTALQEQMGLKLESRKVPVEVLVIDHAEPATEN